MNSNGPNINLDKGIASLVLTFKQDAIGGNMEVVPPDSGERKRKLAELETRLKNGDLSALSELTAMGIEYKKTDLSNGYRIEFEGRVITYTYPNSNVVYNPKTHVYYYTGELVLHSGATLEPVNQSSGTSDPSYGDIAAKLSRQQGSYANDAVNISSTITKPWENPQGSPIFKKLLEDMKYDLKEAGLSLDENVLTSLLRSAWYASIPAKRSENIDTRSFVNTVVEKLAKMLNNLKANPDNLNEYTVNPMNIGVNDSTAIFLGGRCEKYDDGYWHVDDDQQDKKLQATFKTVLDQIYAKYPDVSKTLLENLFKTCMNTIFVNAQSLEQNYLGIKPSYINTISLSNLIKNIMIEFSKWITDYSKYDQRVADEKPRGGKSHYNNSQRSDIMSGASGLLPSISLVQQSIVNNCKGIVNGNSLNTEFGMDTNGNIVFEDGNTKKVFDEIVKQLKNTMQTVASESLNKLAKAAGMSVDNLLKRLVQTAWIATYRTFNSSWSKHDLTKFVNKVMANLQGMFKQLEKNPAFLEVFTRRTAYADTTITGGLKHYNTNTTYGNDEKIEYSYPITYDDGSVHISDTVDDKDYQATMNDLLKRLIDAYPSLDATFITTLFRSAQRAALNACMDNVNDCPYGTANNGSRVEDYNNKDWSGRNNRQKDKNRIHMDELVQMTLYHFDKLLYSTLINYQK